MALVKTLIGNCKGPQGDPGIPGERGSRILSGTAINGTSTSETAYATGIPDSLVNDHYINTINGNIYRCTKSGDANTAKWVYVGNVTSNNTFNVELGQLWEEFDTGLGEVKSIAGRENTGELVAVGTSKTSSSSGAIAYSYDGGENWELVNDITSAIGHASSIDILNSVCYNINTGVFCAVGEEGRILKSYNGVQWSASAVVKMEKLNCVIWKEGMDKFIAVGNENMPGNQRGLLHIINTDVDTQDFEMGIEDTIYLSDQFDTYNEFILNTIVSNNPYMIIGGSNGMIASPDEGITWIECNKDRPYKSIKSIKYDNGYFRGVTSDGYVFNTINPDNIDEWTDYYEITDKLNDIEKIDELDVYIAVGQKSSNVDIRYSPDGTTQDSWNETCDDISENDRSSESAGALLCASRIPGVGTILGKNDGKILKLKTDIVSKNTTDAVEEMYTKLILQKS